jgi:hypothetical protein
MATSTLIRSKGPSYQTAPLRDYSPDHQRLALELYDAARQQIRSGGTSDYKGSYSIFDGEGHTTTGKIIIISKKAMGRGTATGRTCATAFMCSSERTADTATASGPNCCPRICLTSRTL